MNRLEQIEQAWGRATEGPFKASSSRESAGVWTKEPRCKVATVYRPDYPPVLSREGCLENAQFFALSWEAVRDLTAVARAAVALDGCPGAGSLELHEALIPLMKEVAS